MMNWISNYFFVISGTVSSNTDLTGGILFFLLFFIIPLIVMVSVERAEVRNINYNTKLTKSELEQIKSGADKLGISEDEFVGISIRKMSSGWNEMNDVIK